MLNPGRSRVKVERGAGIFDMNTILRQRPQDGRETPEAVYRQSVTGFLGVDFVQSAHGTFCRSDHRVSERFRSSPIVIFEEDRGKGGRG